jgi:hypothetical protein
MASRCGPRLRHQHSGWGYRGDEVLRLAVVACICALPLQPLGDQRLEEGGGPGIPVGRGALLRLRKAEEQKR